MKTRKVPSTPDFSAAKRIAPAVSSGSGSTAYSSATPQISSDGEGLDEGVRPVAEREHGTVHAVGSQPFEDVHDHRPLDDGQHLLGDLVSERPKPRALAADENDGVHQLVVVVVPDALEGFVVVVELPGLVVVVAVPG